MADNIMAIELGRLSLSRITYRCDLQQDSGHPIPLGVIAEMTIGRVRALGLIARVDLSREEAGAIGRLIRPKLSKPFDFLLEEFKWAFSETRPGEALSRLADRFSESLQFDPPHSEEMRKILPVGPAASELVLSDLRRRRDEEFYLMLADTWGGAPKRVEPSLDMTRLAA